MNTISGHEIPNKMIENHLATLINKFFKILPLKEHEEPSLKDYMSSLQFELIGSQSLITAFHYDSRYLTLIVILQYMINNPCDVVEVKRQVFNAISICKKLKEKYCVYGGVVDERLG